MAKFTAMVEGGAKLKARFDAADAKIRAQVVKDLNRYGVILASQLRAKAPKDQGNLRVGIHSEPATTANPIVTIRSNAAYTLPVDQGSRPHFPPAAALVGWAKRHPFGDMTPEAEAFLIARAISKRGGKAAHFIEPVTTPAKSEVVRLLQSSLSAVKI